MEISDEGATILVADDNPNNIQVIESMLSDFGFDVRIALNGVEAIECIEEELPDLIILDIHMPEMDGYTCCQVLKEREDTRDIPVIFASAMGDEFNKVKGFELGAVDYLTKPLNMEELKARVCVHLKLRRQQLQLTEQTAELILFNNTMLDREMRIIELKAEVNNLAEQLGQPAPYDVVE